MVIALCIDDEAVVTPTNATLTTPTSYKRGWQRSFHRIATLS